MTRVSDGACLSALLEADGPLTTGEVARAVLGEEANGRNVVVTLHALERRGLVRRCPNGMASDQWEAKEPMTIEQAIGHLEGAAVWYERRDPALARLLRRDCNELRYRRAQR